MIKKLCFLFVFMALVVNVLADVPKTINYQGRLTDVSGNPVTDGVYNIVVSLYAAATGGTALWDENLSVQVKNGYFNTILGAIETFESRGVDFNSQYYLGIKVGLDLEMTPRQPLNGVPYAMNVANGAITTDKIAANAVTKQWTEMDTTLKTWNIYGNQQILSKEITLTKAATVIAFAKCNYGIVSGTTASVCQFNIDMEGVGGDNSEISVSTNIPSSAVSIIGVADFDAGTHTVTFNINPISISPGGESIKTNRHSLVIMVFYK